MRRDKSNLIISVLTLCIIGLIALAGWLALKSLPSRQLSRLPGFVQTWVIPEPESALLPTVALSGDADALLTMSTPIPQEVAAVVTDTVSADTSAAADTAIVATDALPTETNRDTSPIADRDTHAHPDCR